MLSMYAFNFHFLVFVIRHFTRYFFLKQFINAYESNLNRGQIIYEFLINEYILYLDT